MIGVMLGLLAGAASQPAAVPPPPLVIVTPVPREAPPPPLDGPVPAVRATSNLPLPSLFSSDDYPTAALRNGETGTVTFSVAIDRDGRVTECLITNSSGSASLDSTTCSIITRRARFRPARDGSGRTVEDRAIARVRWSLPPRPPIPFADQKQVLVFTINSGGEVIKCRSEGSARQSTDDASCSFMMTKVAAIAQAQKRLALPNREMVLQQGVLIGGPEAARSVGRGRGETLRILNALALDIDAAGNILRCVVAEGDVSAQWVDLECKDTAKTKFEALDPAASDRSERHAVRYWATYTRPIG